jgi:hypothetical protein
MILPGDVSERRDQQGFAHLSRFLARFSAPTGATVLLGQAIGSVLTAFGISSCAQLSAGAGCVASTVTGTAFIALVPDNSSSSR